MSGTGCAIDFCPGVSLGKYTGTVLIPSKILPSILKNQPFNFSPAEIKRQIAKGEDGRRVCALHVKKHATDCNDEGFEMHNLQSDLIYDFIIQGHISPQPGYLIRKGMTEDDFIQCLKRRKVDNTYDKEDPHIETGASHIAEKYAALLAEKNTLSKKVVGMTGQLTKTKNELSITKDSLASAKDQIKRLEADA